MPVALSYPGVYVEELPSGQFTITGVPTSITAFIGRTVCGPTDQPVTLFNFGDYERMCGGLAYDFPLSYAVQDFFMNGGGQAVVARLFGPIDWTTSASAALIAIQAALTPDKPADYDFTTLLAAGNTAANALSAPEQSPALMLMKTFTASVKSTDTSDAFAAAVNALTIPADPGSAATMMLDDNGGGPIAAAAGAVASAVLAAAFDSTGNSINPVATVTDLQSAASAASGDFQEGPQMKVARLVAKALNVAAGASVQAAIDASLTAAGSSITAVMGKDAPGAADLTTLVFGIQQAFDTDFPAPTSTPATAVTAAIIAKSISTNMTALTGSAANAVGTAANTASTAASATVLSVIQAALNAATNAAFSVPDDQVLSLVAANDGSWGNMLTATIDTENITRQSAKMFAQFGLEISDLFNLTVSYARADGSTDIERFTNVTVKNIAGATKPLANRIDLVLKDQSQYARVAPGLLPASVPTVATGSATGGNDGQNLQVADYVGDQSQKTGIYMLEKIDLFNLLCIPPDDRVEACQTDPEVYQEAMAYCVDRRAMLIVDPPLAWSGNYKQGELDSITPENLELYGVQTRNAVVYFPRVIKEDTMMGGQLDTFPACGAIAGVIAATDVQRGVWKAPAGQNAGLTNISRLEFSLTDDEQGELNPLGINCLRNLPLLGPVVWGARTLRGADQLSDDFKYLSVRRLALFIEESLYRGTRWAVFEPNNEALWSSLRLTINTFMGDLAKQGAFYGFLVKCDKDTNSQSDIDKGIVTVLVQYAPVKPAEFVVLQFQQNAGLSPS